MCFFNKSIRPRENVQSFERGSFVYRRINGFQISHQRLDILVRNIHARVSQLMNFEVLNFRFREHRFNRCRKACQIICAYDQNVVYSTIPETIQHSCPIFGAFILSGPHTQNVFMPFKIDTYGYVYSLITRSPCNFSPLHQAQLKGVFHHLFLHILWDTSRTAQYSPTHRQPYRSRTYRSAARYHTAALHGT